MLRMVCLATLLIVTTSARVVSQMQVLHSFDFETDDAADKPLASLTDVPAEVIAGARSLKGDSTASAARWNEFYQSPNGALEAQSACEMSFTYRVLAREGDARFYALFRARESRTPGNWHWQDWRGEPGDEGTVRLALETGRRADCYLVIGIENAGAISIDDITIRGGKIPETRLPEPNRMHTSPGNTTYYVDSELGDDADAGTSEGAPWRSLERVNQTDFAAGDSIRFRARRRWSGVLAPGGSGQDGAPIVVLPYGDGRRPRIDAREHDRAAIYLRNQQHWEIAGLEVTNQGAAPGALRIGVLVQIEDYGVAHHIHLRDLYVHDVNGSNVKGYDRGGIIWKSGGDEVPSRYDDLLIEGCHLVRCDRDGIVGPSGNWRRDHWFPSINVVIRGNLLEDIGGDGIVPWACDGAVVEHNTLRGGRRRAADAAAGIWPWSCDNTVVQFNEVSGMKGTRDGQGFDSDWNCRNTLIQYNYSHDNDGGFLLICNPGDTDPAASVGNIGTVVRHNVSQNDGARVIHIGGATQDTLIHNNTFYVGPERDIYAVLSTSWSGWSDNTRFERNIFYSDGRARFEWGESTGNIFEGNVFFGGLEDLPEDPSAISDDPLLLRPGDAGPGLHSLDAYRLRDASPCPEAGASVSGPFGREVRHGK